jgi:hypothetical protein
VSLESLTRFSGQTGQKGGRDYNVSNTSHISPTTARHIAKRGRKAEKGTWSVQSVWSMNEFWSRGPLHPISGVSYLE